MAISCLNTKPCKHERRFGRIRTLVPFSRVYIRLYKLKQAWYFLFRKIIHVPSGTARGFFSLVRNTDATKASDNGVAKKKTSRNGG